MAILLLTNYNNGNIIIELPIGKKHTFYYKNSYILIAGAVRFSGLEIFEQTKSK